MMAEPKDDELSEAMLEETSLIDEDDPLGDIKAAWIMSGEDLEEFTVAKFNRKLKQQDKAEWAVKFVRGETDYEDKMDEIDRLKARQFKLAHAAATGMRVGKAVGKELGTLRHGAYRSIEPRFLASKRGAGDLSRSMMREKGRDPIGKFPRRRAVVGGRRTWR